MLSLVLAAALPAAPARAADDTAWKVSEKLFGKPDKKNPADIKKSKKAKDVSGIACATDTGFPRVCLLADDESQGAQIVILLDGRLRAGHFIRLIDADFKGKPLELDAEGVAYADGAFYVIGSHGYPRHINKDGETLPPAEIAARATANRHLFRVRLDPKAVDPATGALAGTPKIEGTAALAQVITAIPELKPFHDKPLDEEEKGVTVEGVAVRGGQFYAGLRSPVLGKDAAIVAVPLDGLFGDKPGPGTLIRLNLGLDSREKARGVRDLVAVPDGFLILAGPMLDPKGDVVAAGDYTVFAWDGQSAPRKRLDLPAYPDAEKPEALLPLDRSGDGLRVLLFFDGPKEGAPRPVQIP